MRLDVKIMPVGSSSSAFLLPVTPLNDAHQTGFFIFRRGSLVAFAEIASLYERDRHLPVRTLRQQILTAFRDGSFFDLLGVPFQQETTEDGTYVPLRKRKPALHVSWVNEVIEDVAALLFGEGHFPEIETDSKELSDAILELVAEADLSTVMSEAVFRASVGSAVLFVRFMGDPGKLRTFVSVADSTFYTPEFLPTDTSRLIRLTERYKVKGSSLREMGYSIPEDDLSSDFWWKTAWDTVMETGYVPVKVETDEDGRVNDATERDPTRTVQHDLGFVPAIWIKLPGGDDPFDGRCLFARAMDTVIEADYQLSQLGRGLKYSQDPLKVISMDGEVSSEFKKIVAGSDMLVLPEGGEAKLLETNGESARAVMEFASLLRRYAIRSISGSPIDPERLTVPQSGRAMEILNMPLVQLADKMRSVFGSVLLRIFGMVRQAAQKRPVLVNGKTFPKDSGDIRLRWPDWYPPTAMDRLQDVQAVAGATQAKILSTESALRFLSSRFDIDSVEDELKRLEKETNDDARRQQQQQQPGNGQQQQEA